MLSDILLFAVLTSMIRMSTSCPSVKVEWMFSEVTERSGLQTGTATTKREQIKLVSHRPFHATIFRGFD